MVTYSGICLGGPNAGKFVKSSSPEIVTVEWHDNPFDIMDTSSAPDAGEVAYDRFIYRHKFLAQHNGDDMCAWVPDGKDVGWAALHLLEHYANTTGTTT